MDNELMLHHQNAVKAMIIVRDTCALLKIEYFLLAGSCLGAVRHKGFIPWDDDMDIGILVQDYEKFEDAIVKKLPSEYHWISYKNSDNFPRLYGKILYNGTALIDVFKIVKTSKSWLGRKFQWTFRKFIYAAWKGKFEKNSQEIYTIKRKIGYIITTPLRIFMSEELLRKMCQWNEHRFARSNNYDYMNIYSVYSMDKEIINREWIEKKSVVTFEGEKFFTVGDTDAYLTHLYGDYMTPPAEKERKLRHFKNKFE